ncbi:MAG TPA: O-antigen ligase family protein [Flavisolibacter sp.]
MTAHKNSGNSIGNHWRNEALFYTMLLMILGLFLSRATLSIAILLFLAFAMVHLNFIKQVKAFFTTPYPAIFSLLFFIPLLSGLWSSDMNKWSDVVRIKLPLLFIPLAFAGNWKLSATQWLLIAAIFLMLVFGGCVWGLIDYWQNTAQIHEDYLKAKTIRTPLENDHVRFSWLVSVAVILCFLLLAGSRQRLERMVLSALLIFFTIYLHILSARTGLFSLYIFILLYAGWLLQKNKNRKWAVASLVLLLALPLAAYFVLPTFKARLLYNLYDLSFARKSEYLPGSSDGARTMSLKAGWQVLQQNPLGAGAGDVRAEADKWYTANVPQVLPTDKFNPSSEWLMYGGFAGWPGVILFTVVMVLPFIYRPGSHPVFWTAFHATAAFSFAFDMGLEVQYGVFLYVFITFWWWKWLNGNRQTLPKFAAS